MPSELALAIQQVCEEKKLSIEAVKQTIEAALASAFRKDFGNKLQNLKVNFDLESGLFKVYDIKIVVEDELKAEYDVMRERIESLKAEAERTGDHELLSKTLSEMKKEGEETTEGAEEEKRFNPRTMLSLSEAQVIQPTIAIGEELIQELIVPAEFGRMAAQTAKQVIIQKIREAERDNVFSEFKDKQGELINGTIQRREGRVVLVDLGSAMGVMPPQDQVERETYKPGARFKFYLRAVEQTQKGPEVIVSRSAAEMVRKLFKLEVPEIGNGTVQIKSVAREAGSRSKVAVWSKDEGVDPIGACVGQRGTRVQTIINELGGEKVDIIEWHEDLKDFISKALSPAKITSVELDEENHVAKATVKEDQYSLAIGKAGQNVRLAAKLTGWRIDIMADGGLTESSETIADTAVENSETVVDEKSPIAPEEQTIEEQPVVEAFKDEVLE